MKKVKVGVGFGNNLLLTRQMIAAKLYPIAENLFSVFLVLNNYCVVNAPGTPLRVRLGEQVIIIISKVKM